MSEPRNVETCESMLSNEQKTKPMARYARVGGHAGVEEQSMYAMGFPRNLGDLSCSL